MSNKFPFFHLIKRPSRALKKYNYDLHLSCYVKPNSSFNRVTAVGTNRIDVSVTAAPRDGAANFAVSQIIADVSLKRLKRFTETYTSQQILTISLTLIQVFQVPKSTVEVIRGAKARQKTLCITELSIGDDQEAFLQQATQALVNATERKHSR
ncbi:hypothetical protein N7466_009557 [Penicillium verhagenii]|uniref:uncharacterized protein n=1 Tax=Penicillium verhagenii TaxID=1562060 RepID=UPI0025459559|nr:uncharacterized protein N7466_009557 [Penicillium verhagenii]KAJ5921231.1 hypothetical protein N7466_009557 [Penicillium verhagenii]